MDRPRLNAIFQRQIHGDHALLELAQRRFSESGLGAEFYPNSPDELRDALRFLPVPPGFYTAHLPRHIDLLDAGGRQCVCAFAAAADSRAIGLVVHDQRDAATRFGDYIEAAQELNADLVKQGAAPLVLIEYAAWLEPQRFLAIHEALRDAERIGACLDIGHLGLYHAQRAFLQEHPELDFWRLKVHTAELRVHVASVTAACRTALPGVLQMVASLGRLGKHLHFHLHDGHPGSTFSSAGVSDHLSFFQEIPLPFSHCGSYTLPSLFGPVGLQRIIAAARAALPDKKLSFTLEIHAPPQGRYPLAEYAPLFAHWSDLYQAERMQYWIEVLLRNQRLVQEAWDASR